MEDIISAVSMSTSRQWAEEEKNLLIEGNYGFLFDWLTPIETKQIEDSKWEKILTKINAFAGGSSALSMKQANNLKRNGLILSLCQNKQW